MQYFSKGLAVLLLMCSLPAAAEIRVQDGYVRGMPPGHPVTAAFMRLQNTGDQDVVIDGGRTGVAGQVEFHTHVHNDGKMRMQQMPSITVPAHGEFVLRPGENHVMLIGLQRPLREGDTVSLTLLSGNKEIVSAELPVRSVLNEHRYHH